MKRWYNEGEDITDAMYRQFSDNAKRYAEWSRDTTSFPHEERAVYQKLSAMGVYDDTGCARRL